MAGLPEQISPLHQRANSQGSNSGNPQEGIGDLVSQLDSSGISPNILPYDIVSLRAGVSMGDDSAPPAQVFLPQPYLASDVGTVFPQEDSSLSIQQQASRRSFWGAVGSRKRNLGCFVSIILATVFACSLPPAFSAPMLQHGVYLRRDYSRIPDQQGFGAALDYSVFIVYGPDAYLYFPNLYRKKSDLLLSISVQSDNSLTVAPYYKNDFNTLLQILVWMYEDAKRPVHERTLRSAVESHLAGSYSEFTTPEERDRFLAAFDAYSAELLVQVGPKADSYTLIDYFGERRRAYYQSLLAKSDFSVYSEQELKDLLYITRHLEKFYQNYNLYNLFTDADNSFHATGFPSFIEEEVFWKDVKYRRLGEYPLLGKRV